MATTSDRPPARCLDLTRLISRLGRGPATGIDKVERAYLDHLLADPVPLYLQVRTSLGHVLLDRAGAAALVERLDARVPWGPPDVIGRLSRRMSGAKRRGEADLRRLSVGRAPRGGLARLLARRLPPGAAYLNVGHSNLTEEVLAAWRAHPGGRVAVLIHDTIPLDVPEFQRPGTVAAFEAKLRRVAMHADLAIYNSRSTRSHAERWFRAWGALRPESLVAPLGVPRPVPDAAALPPDLPPPPPYFVTVGTIEPRKNHALLLDVWDRLSRDMPAERLPHLVIAGARGWANEDVFRRLDSSPLAGRHVHERAGLSDGAVAALLQGATALLFPSRAEGFGLPPLEAAMLGTPVVCATLEVYREMLGDAAVYGSPDDVYFWENRVRSMAEEVRARGLGTVTGRVPARGFPSWQDHFNLVLKVT